MTPTFLFILVSSFWMSVTCSPGFVLNSVDFSQPKIKNDSSCVTANQQNVRMTDFVTMGDDDCPHDEIPECYLCYGTTWINFSLQPYQNFSGMVVEYYGQQYSDGGQMVGEQLLSTQDVVMDLIKDQVYPWPMAVTFDKTFSGRIGSRTRLYKKNSPDQEIFSLTALYTLVDPPEPKRDLSLSNQFIKFRRK